MLIDRLVGFGLCLAAIVCYSHEVVDTKMRSLSAINLCMNLFAQLSGLENAVKDRQHLEAMGLGGSFLRRSRIANIRIAVNDRQHSCLVHSIFSSP